MLKEGRLMLINGSSLVCKNDWMIEWLIFGSGAKWSPFENGSDQKGVTDYSDGLLSVDRKSKLKEAITRVVSVFNLPLVWYYLPYCFLIC